MNVLVNLNIYLNISVKKILIEYKVNLIKDDCIYLLLLF